MSALNVAEWILRAGERRPDATAIRYRGAAVSYATLRERVARTAGALRARGLARERRVLVALPDTPELVQTFLGAIWAGAIPILLNPALRADDYRAFVDDFRPDLLIATDDVAAAVDDVPTLTTKTLGALVEASAPLSTPAATDADDPAFWLLSSGTTGRPKGVVHLHRSVPVVCAGYGREILGIEPTDVCHATSKGFFAYGLGASVYLPLAAGATVVLVPEPFAPARTWATLAAERPSLFFAVPSVYRALLEAAPDGARDALSTVRVAVSAGEALPESLFDEWHRRFGVAILDGIGATEMLYIYCTNRRGRIVPGSVGMPAPGYEVRLEADDGAPAADGEVGMMRVRGGSLAERYWRRVDATRGAFQGEWYATGDRAVRSPDGTFRILGRGDDLFKVSGQWVLPTDVEAVVATVRGVREVAVVGNETGTGLLEVVACVVPDDGAGADGIEGAIRTASAERLPRYKRPGRVVFVDALPRTATGKLQRAVLRETIRRTIA